MGGPPVCPALPLSVSGRALVGGGWVRRLPVGHRWRRTVGSRRSPRASCGAGAGGAGGGGAGGAPGRRRSGVGGWPWSRGGGGPRAAGPPGRGGGKRDRAGTAQGGVAAKFPQ